MTRECDGGCGASLACNWTSNDNPVKYFLSRPLESVVNWWFRTREHLHHSMESYSHYMDCFVQQYPGVIGMCVLLSTIVYL